MTFFPLSSLFLSNDIIVCVHSELHLNMNQWSLGGKQPTQRLLHCAPPYFLKPAGLLHEDRFLFFPVERPSESLTLLTTGGGGGGAGVRSGLLSNSSEVWTEPKQPELIQDS